MNLPDNDELIFLRDLLLAHALGADAKRQRDALAFIFKEQISKRERCPKIDAQTLYNVAAPSGAKSAKDAAYGLARDIKKQLADFYEKHPVRLRLRYRAQFVGGGDYRLAFHPYDPTPQQVVHAPEFWRPHLPPVGGARFFILNPFSLWSGTKRIFAIQRWERKRIKTRFDISKFRVSSKQVIVMYLLGLSRVCFIS